MAIWIDTLGGLKVFKDDVERPELRARKLRCALLVYLGVEGEATKDTLTRVFWPDDDTTKVASRLSSNIKSIRDDCGPDCIQTHGDSYKANPELLGVDVPHFRAAVSEGEYQTALSLYGGGFLAGEHLSGSGQFEEWRDKVEDELEHLHHSALRRRVDELLEGGNLQDAVDVAKQWATTYPMSEGGNLAYTNLLAKTGETVGALRHVDELYRRFSAEDVLVPKSIQKLYNSIDSGEFETELAPSPSQDAGSEDPVAHVTREATKPKKKKKKKTTRRAKKPPPRPEEKGLLPWIGWVAERVAYEIKNRWVYVVSIAFAAVGSAGEVVAQIIDLEQYLYRRWLFVYLVIFAITVAITWTVEHFHLSAKPESGEARRALWGLLTWRGFPVLMIATGTIAPCIRFWPPDPVVDDVSVQTQTKNHIAILYFEVLRTDADLQRFGIQLTGELTRAFTEFSAISHYSVASPDAIQASRDPDVDGRTIALQANAEYMVSGIIDLLGDSVLVQVYLSEVEAGHSIMSENFKGPFEGAWEWALISDISKRIDEALRPEFGERIHYEPDTESPDAWRRFGTGQELRKSVWQDLVSGGEITDGWWAQLERARASFEDAARFDPEWCEPLIGLAYVSEIAATALSAAQLPANRTAILEEFDRGLAALEQAFTLVPENARVFERQGILLFERAHHTLDPAVARETLSRARESLQEAADRDGTLADARKILTEILFLEGEFQLARARIRDAIAADAYLHAAIELRNLLARTELNLGEDEAARDNCREVQTRIPDLAAGFECELEVLAWGDSLEVDPDAALRLADSVITLGRSDPQPNHRLRVLMDMAGVMARLEQYDRARAYLDSARSTPTWPGSPAIWQEAAAEVRLQNHAAAIDILRQIVEETPLDGGGFLRWRVFAPLRQEPEFQELLARVEG